MIAIIDYKAGNVASVQNALTRLGAESIITNDAAVIQVAAGVIFPGQGRAGQAMAELNRLGLVEALKSLKQPFLGICLGMQLLVETSDEDNVQCLGIIPGTNKKFSGPLPVPHMGWNTVHNDYFYFVHSYYVVTEPQYVTSTSRYGIDFASSIQKGNFTGVQFHPEKSGVAGETYLKNFLRLC